MKTPEFGSHLPPEMLHKLDEVRRRHRRVQVQTGLLRGFAVLLAAMLTAMALDWLLVLRDERLRWAFTLLALGCGVAGLVRWGLLPLLRSRPLDEFARDVDRAHPFLEERYLTLTEFSRNADAPEIRGSSAMIEKVAKQAAGLSSGVAVVSVISRAELMRAAKFFLIPAGLFVLLFALDFQRAGILCRRFLEPGAELSLTRVEAKPGDIKIGKGESVTLEIIASGKRPETATLFLRSESGHADQVDLRRAGSSGDTFGYTRNAVVESFEYRARAGDGQTEWHKVTVVDRPKLAQVKLRIVPPAYSRLPVVEEQALPHQVRALEGSALELSFQADQPLKSLVLSFADGKTQVLSEKADGFYHFNTTLSNSLSFQPVLLNAHDMENLDKPSCEIVVYQDEPPTVRVLSPNDDITAQSTEKVKVDLEARDDLGIASAELDVTIRDETNSRSVVIPIPLGAEQGARLVRKEVELDLAQFDLKQDQELTYVVRVTDTKSTPSSGASPAPNNTATAGNQSQQPSPAGNPPAGQPAENATGSGQTNSSGNAMASQTPGQNQGQPQNQNLAQNQSQNPGQNQNQTSNPGQNQNQSQDPAQNQNQTAQNQSGNQNQPQNPNSSQNQPGNQSQAQNQSQNPGQNQSQNQSGNQGQNQNQSQTAQNQTGNQNQPQNQSQNQPGNQNQSQNQNQNQGQNQNPQLAGNQSTNSQQQQQSQGDQPPPNDMPKRGLDAGGQSATAQPMTIKVDEWGGSFEGQQREKLEIAIDPILKLLDELLGKAQDGTEATLSSGRQSAGLARTPHEPLEAAQDNLRQADRAVTDLRTKSDGTPYAFIGLQLQDLRDTHLSPARQELGEVTWEVPKLTNDLGSLEQASFHIRSAREQLAALTRTYATAKLDNKLADVSQHIEKMHQIFIEDSQALLNPSKSPLNSQNRKMAEVSDEYAEKLKQLLEEQKKIMDELAKVLAGDPRMLRRFLAMQQLQGTTLRDQLTLLNQRQQALALEDAQWTTTAESNRPALLRQRVNAEAAEQLEVAGLASKMQENMLTWWPLDLPVDRADIVAVRALATDVSRLATGAAASDKPDASLAAAKQALDKLRQLSEQLPTLATNEADAAKLGGFVANRMQETDELITRQSGWIKKAESLQAGDFATAVEVDQHRLTVETTTLEGKLDTAVVSLSRISTKVAAKADALVLTTRLEILPEESGAEDALGQKDLNEAADRQAAATNAFVKAETQFDEMLKLMAEELDKAPPPTDPGSVPSLDDMLTMLENERKAAEQLGLSARPMNVSVQRDWTSPSSSSGSGSQGGQARAQAQAAQQQARNAARNGQRQGRGNFNRGGFRNQRGRGTTSQPGSNEQGVAGDPSEAGPKAPVASWNTLVSKLGDEIRQGRDNVPPEQYRQAIEKYFEQISESMPVTPPPASETGH